ncbi:MAG: GNAT family N-acetyltransferase [Candidatus Obscuribacterales bacterium]|nr:GNAT family N-acetyltransferase [Candidatus Obscuribacterales bacterium]
MLAIETQRLILRDWTLADSKSAQEYAACPEVCKFMVWGPNSDSETRDFIRRSIDLSKERPRQSFELAMVLKDENVVAGGIGLHINDRANQSAMIGYVLNRNYWGQGLVTEAARRLLELGFGELSLHRICATCDAENVGSQRVLEKCGMRREAHYKQDMLIKGQWRDSFFYAILQEEWQAAHF